MFHRSRQHCVPCFLAVLQYTVLVASFTSRIDSGMMQITKYASSESSLITLGLFSSPKSSPLEDEPWKKNDSYWDMLQEASKDPVTFEKFIEESTRRKKLGEPLDGMKVDISAEEDVTPKKKGKYVPIEEWDAKQKDNMSAEERLQWECQRGGNQLRQNDILVHHLNSF